MTAIAVVAIIGTIVVVIAGAAKLANTGKPPRRSRPMGPMTSEQVRAMAARTTERKQQHPQKCNCLVCSSIESWQYQQYKARRDRNARYRARYDAERKRGK